MSKRNVTYKNGIVYRKKGIVVPVDTSFEVVQANKIGTVGPETDLVNQNQVNEFVLKTLAQLLGVPYLFTANLQYYKSTASDLGEYAAYLPAGFSVTIACSEGSGVTQQIADANALVRARELALEQIAFNAVITNTSGYGSFNGLNAGMLGNQ